MKNNMSTEQKPETKARTPEQIAERIATEHERYGSQLGAVPVRELIARELAAKDAEIERIQKQFGTCSVCGFVAWTNHDKNTEHCEFCKLRQQHKAQTALLAEACRSIEDMKASLHHMEACAVCAEDWNDCDHGLKSFSRVGVAAEFLSRPEVAALLAGKEKA